MTLTELCLSFDRSMDLTKSGIILVGCCFCWVRDNDDQQIKLIEASRMMDINDLKGEVTFLSHAPTAGELEEWLRARKPNASMTITSCNGDVPTINVDVDDDVVGLHKGVGQYQTLVSALAALVLEVAG